MAEKNDTGLKLEDELPESIDYPVVRKKFRVTIYVEATLDSGARGGLLLTSPEGVLHTKALVERLLAQPELVERLLRCRAVEAARRAVKALEVEYRRSGSSEHELLESIFADLEPDARAYFTEELEDGVSAYYFDGCRATVEWASLAEIGRG
jgi:hypothetical protein